MELCSVRDSAVNGFASPFCVPSLGVAVRSFSDEVNRTESPMNAHPEDYELFHVGSFDEDTGSVRPLGEIRSLMRAKDCVTPRS